MSEPRKKTIAWVSTTYFAEGLPYMIVRILSTVYFTDVGAKERYIGYLNFLGIPWNLKFLWASLLDSLSTKRLWMTILQGLIGALTLLISALCFAAHRVGDDGMVLLAVAVIFVGMAFVSATNDIAIDAHYLEGLTDKGEQAEFSGFRVMAYRVAVIYARTGLVAVSVWFGAGVAGNANQAWGYAFAAGGITMIALAIFHAVFLPRFEKPREVRKKWIEVLVEFKRAFVSYLDQERVAVILLFIIAYKLGDEIMFAMVTPFLKREIGVSDKQFVWLGGLVGAFGAVVGAMVGGWWIKKVGLKRAMWPLTLLMNLNIWAYIWLAWAKPDPKTLDGITLIAFIHGYEQVAAGLGSAALLIFLLRTCKAEFKAAHYAIGSAIMSIGGSSVGGYAGQIVEAIGYRNLFIIAFFASIPGMLLLPFVPLSDEQKK